MDHLDSPRFFGATEQVERETRLVVLCQFAVEILFFGGAALLSDGTALVRHGSLRAIVSVALAVLTLWKIRRTASLFGKTDWISLAFGLISAFAFGLVALLMWAWLWPTEGRADTLSAVGMLCLSALFLGMGFLLVVFPGLARRINRLAAGALGPVTAPERVASRVKDRIAGLFLAGVGALILWVVISIIREVFH